MKKIFKWAMMPPAADKPNLAAKTKFLSVLILVILACYTISANAQVRKAKPVKPVLSHSTNDFHIPWPWFTTGNSGTDTSKNFIGTKDAQPLIFKVNNQKAGYVDFNDISQNTAFGYQTLNSNVVSDIPGITGSNNTAFGFWALYANTSGEVNTAHGSGALYANTEGNVNTSVGGFSLFSNTTGAFNTATGSFALSSNTTGGFNTANGAFALASNTTGSFNIANGTPFTLSGNTEGSDNIATGSHTLYSNLTGNNNTAYGSYSLYSNVSGNKNTAIGDHADVTAGNFHNATAIGNKALVDASNKVRIGNNAVTSIGGAVGWTNYSDERIKDNIKENVPGLEFIKALRPVTYHFSVAKENELMGVKDFSVKDISMPHLKEIKMPGAKGIEIPRDILNKQARDISDEDNEIEKIQFTGFIAQDVDKAAKSIGYDFSGIDKSGKIMGLRYSEFVVPLVKAVQELSMQNEELKKRVEKLETLLASKPNDNSKTSQTISMSGALLEQNVPNPFNKSTTISYTLPEKFTTAQIIITNQNGNVLKRINLPAGRQDVTGEGKGVLNIDASTFSSGTYSYSFIIDGKMMDTKKMVLIK